MNYTKLSYRPEIDGLRAMALVSVILYHAQVILFGRDWLEGGFVGVDILFVISVYLITRIILSELDLKGSFSFINFYERRARRSLPMLFVVICISIPYAWQTFYLQNLSNMRKVSLLQYSSVLITFFIAVLLSMELKEFFHISYSVIQILKIVA